MQHPVCAQSYIVGVGMDMGWLACTGVRSEWLWPWPQAEISPPKHHLWPRLRLLGLYSFFLHAHCEPPHHFPKWWIAFRLPLVVNAFGHLSAISAAFSAFMAVCSSWRLQNCTISHIFLSTADHYSSRRLQIHLQSQEREQVHHTVQV